MRPCLVQNFLNSEGNRFSHIGAVNDIVKQTNKQPVPWDHWFMDGRLPLPTLLSHALVAFTIEFDNEFEHQVPHRTTNHGATTRSHPVPWLVSMVMWSNFMRFVDQEGTTVRELQHRLCMPAKNMRTWLTRLGQWWGYIIVKPNAMVLPTPGGRKAMEIWRTLDSLIAERWRERFGQGTIDRLREALITIVSQMEVVLPDGLPILGYGLFSKGPEDAQRALADAATTSSIPLASLFSKVLLSFAIEFERESEVSLAISANVLRLACEEGLEVSDLPRLSGVSKEAIAMALNFLGKRGYSVIQPKSIASRKKVLVLTPKGRKAQDKYRQLLLAVEERWQARFGEQAIGSLREVLERLDGGPADQQSALFRGLEPYPEGWRASLARPESLPHYPMVLHRGGFPDGS
jgi:DNA-binding MarR family transcriptional regulator